MRTLVIVIAAAAFLLLLPACNTLYGVGQDIEWAGQELQDAAE